MNNSVTITRDDVKKFFKKSGEIALYTSVGVGVGVFVVGRKMKLKYLEDKVLNRFIESLLTNNRDVAFKNGFKAGSGSIVDLIKGDDEILDLIKNYEDEEIANLINDEYINWIENQ